MGVAILSTIMFFPAGIKAQQMARMRLLAAAKAQEMITLFATSTTATPSIDVEAVNPWEVPITYHPYAWDLDSRLASSKFGVIPLPLEIARRIDSTNDEIQGILDQGGMLYYSQPQAATTLQENTLAAGSPPNENQKLVFAITGYAQNNAWPVFPMKAWPYYAEFPAPPMHGLRAWDADVPAALQTTFRNIAEVGGKGIWAEAGGDPDMLPVGQAYMTYTTAHWNDMGDGRNLATQADALKYLQTALWYCQKKGLPPAFWDPLPGGADTPALQKLPLNLLPLSDFTAFAPVEPCDQVNAMRFLAHAATSMTTWLNVTELGGQPSVGTGFDVPALSGAPLPGVDSSPALSGTHALTHDKILYYHESAMRLAMLFAARYPNDWGAPRPMQRALMTDHPLIEPDLFPSVALPLLSGPIAGASPAATGQQWRPIADPPVRHIGVSYSFPGAAVKEDGMAGSPWGDRAHYTLTRRFTAAERCRQIVFWSVDWQSFADAETAPSAPVDAARYPLSAPAPGRVLANKTVNSDLSGKNGDRSDRMGAVPFREETMFRARNPEGPMLFRRDVSAQAAGTDVRTLAPVITVPPPAGYTWMTPGWNWMVLSPADANPIISSDQGSDLEHRKAFVGYYGADRNFNFRVDKGSLPKSTRLRAAFVARFNFYDGRVPAQIR